MGGVRVAVLALVLLLPAPAALAEDAPFIDWNPLLPSLAPDYHPSRAKDCADGRNSCIEQTLDQMYARFDRLYAQCDHNALFALTYIRVTEAFRKAILRGFFEEPRFLQMEDRVFARMYFETYDAWVQGRRQYVPPAWREALDAARARSVNGIGNLLMSMNAHVNRDMPFMLEALGQRKPDGSSRKPDHDRGNRVLQPLYDDVLSEMDARFDDSISNYDVKGTTADDLALFQVLPAWREAAWRNAELLGRARTPAERKAVADWIESYALQQARFIEANTTIKSSGPRDARCAAYRRTHQEHGGKARALVGRRGLRASRRGIVRVRVSCDMGIRDCRGALSLTRGGRRLAADRRLALGPGRSRALRLRLRGPARRALRRRGRLRVRETVSTVSPWGTTRSVSTRARVTQPR